MTAGRRSNLTFLALLVAQFILLSFSVRNADGARTRLEEAALAAVAPVTRVVDSSIEGFRGVPDRFKSRLDLENEVVALEQQVDALMMERSRLQHVEDQVERLSDALGYKAPFEGQVRLADVVYVDHSSRLQTLFLYLPGRPAGLSSPVTAPDGLVGRVILAEGAYSKVQLITDRASGVGAMIERTRRQGIARGAGRGGMTLEYLPLQADVLVGDRVVTSGTDGIYPRGVAIGTVTKVEPGTELFHRVELIPAVDFGLLDQVFVVLGDTLPGRLKGSMSASP
ncbi:MAG: rod shape-determining protein MreC [Acidobacteriota bacterium]|nr:rod shape-determining protein MreC [Acidobacteriota bacterium]